ncbi:glycosyltransferase family 4 protein [Flavobacterium oreochromis]|uniref:glycosyltransferase family 4 protein n=1 Tax=Flavobacterium oreochromis TaxID=2906078 RepID=UPI00385B6232
MVRKNVLHVITVSFAINHFFGNQFKYLKKKTNNVYHLVCTPSEDFLSLSESLEYIPYPLVVNRDISLFKDFIAVVKLFFYIKKNKIEVVVGHTPKGGLVAMLAAFLSGCKKRIYFRHGLVYETSKGWKKQLLKNIERFSGALATQVVCVSNSVKEISEKDRLSKISKNILLGKGTCNGVDALCRFNPENFDDLELSILRNKIDINQGDFVVGYVGRLVKDKGIIELLDAWKILLNQNKKIKLLLVGPLEKRDSIPEDYVEFINNEKSIIYTDFVIDSSPYFKLMDIFVLPTYREGFPTVSLEASSMKIPVLITKATGCAESILEDITGKFISHNPDEIADKIKSYMQNPRERALHGENGRNFVLDNFEQTIVWDIIYKELNI